MKIKLYLLLFFSFFLHQNMIGQIDLPPLNLKCGTPWVESVQINWTRLDGAEFYIVEGWMDGSLRKKDTLSAFYSNYRFAELDYNGPTSVNAIVTAIGKPGFKNTTDSIICDRLDCPEISLIVDFNIDEFCIGFDETIFVQYIADFTDPSVPNGWGTGNYRFTGEGINEFGLFNIEDLPQGDYSFSINYQENNCIYSTSKNFSVIVPEPVEIECQQDLFLNALGVKWTKAPLAGGYELFINDSLITTQSNRFYLHLPQFPGEEIDIKVLPIGNNNCLYLSSEATCKAPDVSSILTSSENETISIFPNPSSGVFEIFSEKEVEKIEVFDLAGKKQREIFDAEIDLSNSNSGIYFLKIHIENNVILKKVVKI